MNKDKDIKKLFEAAGLSEELQSNIAGLIEAKVAALVADFKQTEAAKNNAKVLEFQKKAENKINEMREALANQTTKETNKLIDSMTVFTENVVADWVEANKPELKSQMKQELFESFFASLKESFSKHNLILPEDEAGIDLLSETENKLNKAKEALAEKHKQLVQYRAKLNNEIKRSAILECSNAITSLVSKKKFEQAADNLPFTGDTSAFKKNLKALMESKAYEAINTSDNPKSKNVLGENKTKTSLTSKFVVPGKKTLNERQDALVTPGMTKTENAEFETAVDVEDFRIFF